MESRRTERVSETLREEIEELVKWELSDPRIEVSGVAEVLISPDARQARVRLLLPGDKGQQQQTLEALASARGFLRRELGRRLDMFRLPELQFEAALPAEITDRAVHLLRRKIKV